VASDNIVGEALQECSDAVRMGVQLLPVDLTDLWTFVKTFEFYFMKVLKKNPDSWARDRARVTTLARAIGTLAEFLALLEKATTITIAHLHESFIVISPACPGPSEVEVDREYCASLLSPPVADSADQRG